MYLVTVTVKNPHAKPFCMVITAPDAKVACAQAKRQFRAPDAKGATFSAEVFA